MILHKLSDELEHKLPKELQTIRKFYFNDVEDDENEFKRKDSVS